MTQTNNEREALLKTQDFIERIIEHTTDDWAKTELREVFNFIEHSLEKKPISQNEQQEAVGYIDEADDGIFGDVQKGIAEGLCKVGDLLYTSPTKQIPDGWISVKDRLPEVDQYCLYYAPIFEQKNAWSNVWAGIYDGNGNFSSRSGFLGGQEVTHWMPLPEAPTTSETNTEVGE